ncbi:DUF4811 domain-containing protein [Liquorilactobacillus satsumensis]|uniref:DUF4811 domain-containing protein n=1 Tax=Liquorilactobacillus satsumensis DSM 16230 = JCM 12392 TaxID=1423801 RepID=A0A0R1V035_9LACO|nr:DUF4811 domain-containing protein [Liquorilactobacillus satsumensis]KRL98838.1 hypothetical protein FD50_GL000651 [Liquorilactobacillus satsumensis DSM 16230 = JCM 12392]MCP9312754.1 DUF4811 domain-containing protein [Liquorilactobacillus satsumensis]MCP9327980.1 DUF4811 domain-containing protein [Liquorilactobacillus satsumensis]MCP9359232.1 DUF4811 domain-containing protein [Liquorilactobacillus satsumensis]
MILILSAICLVGIILLSIRAKFPGRGGYLALLTITLLGSQSYLLMDTQFHWGTKLVTKKHTVKIYPIVSFPGSNQVLIYRNLGSGKTKKQIYVTAKGPQKKQKSLLYSDGIKVRLRSYRQKSALRITAQSEYHYTSKLMQVLFAGITNNHHLKATTVTFLLPGNWSVLSTSNARQAGTALKNGKAELKQKVAGRVQKYLRLHPEKATAQPVLKRIEEQALQVETHRILQKFADRQASHD